MSDKGTMYREAVHVLQVRHCVRRPRPPLQQAPNYNQVRMATQKLASCCWLATHPFLGSLATVPLPFSPGREQPQPGRGNNLFYLAIAESTTEPTPPYPTTNVGESQPSKKPLAPPLLNLRHSD